jgi:Flp pilus assembly protein TadD
MIETGQWEDVALDAPDSAAGSHANWVSVVGMSAAHRGDMETATAAIDRLDMLQNKAIADGKNYDAKQIAILGKQVVAVTSLRSGDTEHAIDVAREAAEFEMREMNAPSGPPLPMKPAVELYGDILLAADRPVEALAAYERSMQWVPQRTPSILGLAQAASAAGDTETADEMLTKVKEMPGASPAIK